MVCSACDTGYDSPATSCPRCGTPAGMVVTRRVGLFALACLHIARVAALLDVLAVLAASALVPSNGHDFLAAFLVMLRVPVSIGPLCRFRIDNRVCTHSRVFPNTGTMQPTDVRSRPAQRSSRRRSNFGCATIWPVVAQRAGCAL
jgi:hypothetical protein